MKSNTPCPTILCTVIDSLHKAFRLPQLKAETHTVASPSLPNIQYHLKSIEMPQNSSVFQNV